MALAFYGQPGGSVSVNATPVRETELAAGFVMVKVRLRGASDPDAGRVEGLGDRRRSNHVEGRSIRDGARAALGRGHSARVLAWAPAVVPVTLIEKVQLLLAAIVPPTRLMTPVPDAAVIVPAPHVPVSPFGVAIVEPAGSVSRESDTGQTGGRVGVRDREGERSGTVQRDRGRSECLADCRRR